MFGMSEEKFRRALVNSIRKWKKFNERIIYFYDHLKTPCGFCIEFDDESCPLIQLGICDACLQKSEMEEKTDYQDVLDKLLALKKSILFLTGKLKNLDKMIIIIDCKKCGTTNVINRNKIVEAYDEGYEEIFGEKLEIYEGDMPRCKTCGELLDL